MEDPTGAAVLPFPVHRRSTIDETLDGFPGEDGVPARRSAVLDFSFTPAEDEFRATLRALALTELLPRYREGDAGGVYPAAQIRRVIAFADEFWKGREQERTLVVSGIVAEEVARGDFNCVLPSLGPALNREVLDENTRALMRALTAAATAAHAPTRKPVDLPQPQ